MKYFDRGEKVKWQWGNGQGEGTIKEQFTSDVERTIKGNKVKRSASKDEPAYLIEQADGDKVLKSRSEISPA